MLKTLPGLSLFPSKNASDKYLRSNSSGELNQITGCYIVTSQEWRERVHGVVNAVVGGEVWFDFLEEDH